MKILRVYWVKRIIKMSFFSNVAPRTFRVTHASHSYWASWRHTARERVEAPGCTPEQGHGSREALALGGEGGLWGISSHWPRVTQQVSGPALQGPWVVGPVPLCDGLGVKSGSGRSWGPSYHKSLT